MDACKDTQKSQTNTRPGDPTKYNLRCNRNISEKMTKKDFVYDIRPPIQNARKTESQRQPIVNPIQLRKKQSVDPRIAQYTVISGKTDHDGGGDAPVITGQRTLGFQCNFCKEPIATLLSLSTHVKFHCQRYCKTCYWVLKEDETMEEHVEKSHKVGVRISKSVSDVGS